MIPNQPFRPAPTNTKDKLLEAAVKLVRAKGFSATSVDDLCREAGVTKGGFFHHFPSKEALGVATAKHWSRSTSAFFGAAPYHHLGDPLDRVLGYLDLRAALIGGPVESFSCVAGTMVQEAFLSSSAIRNACNASISGNAAALEADIAAAIKHYKVKGATAQSLALHIQAVLQGAFILSKAQGGPSIARDSIAHLRRYFTLLFKRGDVK